MGFALALQIQLMETTVAESRSAPPPAPPTDGTAVKVPVPPPAIAPLAAAQIQSTGTDASDTTAHRGGPYVLVGAGGAAGLGMSSNPVALARLLRECGVVST